MPGKKAFAVISKIVVVLTLGTICAGFRGALAQAPESPGGSKTEPAAETLTDPHEILRRAHAAINKHDFYQYKGVFAGTGFMVNNSPWVEGTALLQGKTVTGYKKYRLEVAARLPNEVRPETFTIGTDGATFYLIHHDKKTVHSNVSSAVIGARLQRLGQAIAMQQFVHPAPYADEMRARSVRLRRITKVNGEECYELYVRSDDIPDATLWCFSTTDFLPRKLDRIVILPTGEQGTMQWTLSDVTPNPQFDHDPFKLKVPEGYTLTSEPAP